MVREKGKFALWSDRARLGAIRLDFVGDVAWGFEGSESNGQVRGEREGAGASECQDRHAREEGRLTLPYLQSGRGERASASWGEPGLLSAAGSLNPAAFSIMAHYASHVRSLARFRRITKPSIDSITVS